MLFRSVGDVTTEAAVGAEAPSVGVVAEAIKQPAQWCSRQIAAAQSGQNEHRVPIATRRQRKQGTRGRRERGELGRHSRFARHQPLPTKPFRHVITIPARSSSNTLTAHIPDCRVMDTIDRSGAFGGLDSSSCCADGDSAMPPR